MQITKCCFQLPHVAKYTLLNHSSCASAKYS